MSERARPQPLLDPSPFDPALIDAETSDFNAAVEATLAALPSPTEIAPERMRQLRAEGKGIFPLGGPLESAHWIDAPGPAGELALRVTPAPEGGRGTYLHIHGGGWTFNAPEQYDAHNRELAEIAGCRVVSVRYRLAPENPWPACHEDCLAAARWLLAETDGPVVIGGESAGAHLAAGVLLGLREAGLGGRISGAVLTYGMFDLAGTPSARRWGERYLILSTPVIDWFVSNLMAGGDLRDPLASPLQADLSGMPPALFTVGTADPLLDDTLFMAARWQAAGGEARVSVVPGGVHAFDQFDLAISRSARQERAAFVRERLG